MVVFWKDPPLFIVESFQLLSQAIRAVINSEAISFQQPSQSRRRYRRVRPGMWRRCAHGHEFRYLLIICVCGVTRLVQSVKILKSRNRALPLHLNSSTRGHTQLYRPSDQAIQVSQIACWSSTGSRACIPSRSISDVFRLRWLVKCAHARPCGTHQCGTSFTHFSHGLPRRWSVIQYRRTRITNT